MPECLLIRDALRGFKIFKKQFGNNYIFHLSNLLHKEHGLLTDEQLIKKICAGNDSYFREIITRYESQVAATINGILGICTEAEDIGQETFIRFYRSIKDFRMESSVGTYLTRIAINLSLNELKRRKRKLLMFQRFDENYEPSAGAISESPEIEEEIIRTAILKLNPKYRSVLVLRLVNGYSTQETADILKIAEGTVLSRLARAQHKLKEILTPYQGELL